MGVTTTHPLGHGETRGLRVLVKARVPRTPSSLARRLSSRKEKYRAIAFLSQQPGAINPVAVLHRCHFDLKRHGLLCLGEHLALCDLEFATEQLLVGPTAIS